MSDIEKMREIIKAVETRRVVNERIVHRTGDAVQADILAELDTLVTTAPSQYAELGNQKEES